MAVAYGIISLIALLLIGACLAVDRKRDIWLLLLFISVFVCDLGYFLLSISKSLGAALMSNRVSYLGSVFLPMFMLLMILNLCKIKYKKWLPAVLGAVGLVIFAIAASPGLMPIYYKSVSIEVVDGATKLVREYGPLHCIYTIYLMGNFVAMAAVAGYAIVKKKIAGTLHVVFLVCAVLGNIAIWFIERFIPRNFEFLSVSYVFTEVMILLLYGVIQEYSLLGHAEETACISRTAEAYMTGSIVSEENELFSPEQIEQMLKKCEKLVPLTNRERDVLRLILENKKRKDIADGLCVTESTIKKYTSQIYRKISVSSRIELFARLK